MNEYPIRVPMEHSDRSVDLSKPGEAKENSAQLPIEQKD